MSPNLSNIIDLAKNPLDDLAFRHWCKNRLDRDGVLILSPFLQPHAIEQIKQEGNEQQDLAYYCQHKHNVYLNPSDPYFDDQHVRNREVISSKGCITNNQIPLSSPLHSLYQSAEFRDFLCHVLGEAALHEYADPLSSINLHYARNGEELGWHFDNSSFAITLLIQKPENGGVFEYVGGIRGEDDNMSYPLVEAVLNGEVKGKSLDMPTGGLVLFRGHHSLHRVTPVEGNITRMLVVLAYNSQPGIALSESARMTFYGRLN